MQLKKTQKPFKVIKKLKETILQLNTYRLTQTKYYRSSRQSLRGLERASHLEFVTKAIPHDRQPPFAKRSIRERRGVTSVTMAALFLDENKTHDDGDNKENGKKVIGFY